MTPNPFPDYTDLTVDSLSELPDGAVVSDRDGDLWVKAVDRVHRRRGWTLAFEGGHPMLSPWSPLWNGEDLWNEFHPIGLATETDREAVEALPATGGFIGAWGSLTPSGRDDRDLTVENALDRARAHLTGDSEKVSVTIDRDGDGNVTFTLMTTEVVK